MDDKQEQRDPVLRLASASPRRRQLLELIGVPHVVTPADIDETPLADEPPNEYVLRLAHEKAEAVWERHQDLPVLAADTTVVVDDEILGKPESAEDAHYMLGRLSGRDHQVHTAVALRTGDRPQLFHTSTQRALPGIVSTKPQSHPVQTGSPMLNGCAMMNVAPAARASSTRCGIVAWSISVRQSTHLRTPSASA